jgi:hypothetical protein
VVLLPPRTSSRHGQFGTADHKKLNAPRRRGAQWQDVNAKFNENRLIPVYNIILMSLDESADGTTHNHISLMGSDEGLLMTSNFEAFVTAEKADEKSVLRTCLLLRNSVYDRMRCVGDCER